MKKQKKELKRKTVLMAVLSIVLISAMSSLVQAQQQDIPIVDPTGNTNFYYILLSGSSRVDPDETEAMREDRQDMKKAVQEKENPEKKNIKKLVELNSPDTVTVINELRDAANKAQPGEVIVFQYSGHGSDIGIGWNVGEVGPNKTLIWSDFANALSRVKPCVKIVFILDSCRAGDPGSGINFYLGVTPIRDSNGNPLGATHIGILAAQGETSVQTKTYHWPTALMILLGIDRIGGFFTTKILDGISHGNFKVNEIHSYIKTACEKKDKDEDGQECEDPIEESMLPDGTIDRLFVDNDNDGFSDEDQLIILAPTVPQGDIPPRPVTPDDGETVDVDFDLLQWTLAEPNDPVGGTVSCDVWFSDNYPNYGQEPNNPDFTDYATKIVDNQPVESVSLSSLIPPIELEVFKTYYWRVDIYDDSLPEPPAQPFVSSVFIFNTNNVAPVVDAGVADPTWLTDGTVDIDLLGSLVEDDGRPEAATLLWTVTGEPSPGAATIITDPTQLDITVTATEAGTYELTLTADDTEFTGSDTVSVLVYPDWCEATKIIEGLTPRITDYNEDCVTDILDLAIFAREWLLRIDESISE